MSDLREGQQVCVVNVIHRPTGGTWPGSHQEDTDRPERSGTRVGVGRQTGGLA
jgi:hypothetical protein